jgi:hypothetical protein
MIGKALGSIPMRCATKLSGKRLTLVSAFLIVPEPLEHRANMQQETLNRFTLSARMTSISRPLRDQ